MIINHKTFQLHQIYFQLYYITFNML